MARRSDHSREELYEMALAATRSIVEAGGLRALTARNIADAIGYSPGTLYNLFENLDDMIVHLNGRTLDEVHDRLSAGSVTGVPERDLARLLDGYLGFLEDHPNLWSVLFEFSLPRGHALPDWYVGKVAKVLALVEEAFTPLFDAADGEDRRHAARILWAALHGICSLADAGKLHVVTTQSVREMAESLLATFITGLKAERNEGRPTRREG